MMDTRTTQTMSSAVILPKKSRDLSKIDILDDATDWEKMKLTTQKLIAQKNKKAFNYYQDEDNTMADMLYQRTEQRKQKEVTMREHLDYLKQQREKQEKEQLK